MAKTFRNFEDLRQYLKTVEPKVIRFFREAFVLSSRATADYLKNERLTGGTSKTRLAVRSGRLRSSTRPIPVKQKGSSKITAGVQFGTIYAKTHIGPEGGETVIRPKRKQWLTIPLAAAKTEAGVLRGGARSGRWGFTFIKRSDDGTPIIYGQMRRQRGRRVGQVHGEVVPLFVLKKQVRVPVRIGTGGILRRLRVEVLRNVKEMKV